MTLYLLFRIDFIYFIMLLRDSALIYFHVKVAYMVLYSSIKECVFFYDAAINVADERMPNLFSG